MKKRRSFKVKSAIIVIALLLVLAIFLYAHNKSLTGNVIYALPAPQNCSNESIRANWDSIFIESSSNIIISTNVSQGICRGFTAYKIKNGQEAYVLFGGTLDFSGLFGLGNVTSVEANYINFSRNYLNQDQTLINITEITDPNNFHLTNITKRNITNADYAQSSFISSFRMIPENWQEVGIINIYNNNDNQPSYSFTNVTSANNVSKSISGSIYKNYTINTFIYAQITVTTPQVQNCTQNWTQMMINYTGQDRRVKYYIDANNCSNATGIPQNITEYIDVDKNNIIGNTTYLKPGTDVYINSTLLNLSQVYNTTQIVEIKESNITKIKLNYDFSTPLNLYQINFTKQNSTDNYGYLIVEGLSVSKTIYVDKLNSTNNKVCLKNAHVDSISDISAGCNSSSEYLLTCPGNNSGFTCNITNGLFEISGLTSSAAEEFLSASASNCTSNWNCTLWTTCANNQQTRTCVDLNSCNNTQQPATTQLCASCSPNWQCGNWTTCLKNSSQTRTCSDTNNCNPSSSQKTENQTCEYKSISTTQIIIATILILILMVAGIVIYMYMNNKNTPKTPQFSIQENNQNNNQESYQNATDN